MLKKKILLVAGLLLAGCGDSYWLLNNSGGNTEINGNTISNGQCIKLKDSRFNSDFNEKINIKGTAYELNPGHYKWLGSDKPVQVTDEKEIENLDEKCKTPPQTEEKTSANSNNSEQTNPTQEEKTPADSNDSAQTNPTQVACTAHYENFLIICRKQKSDDPFSTDTEDTNYRIHRVTTISLWKEPHIVDSTKVFSDEERQACFQKYDLTAVYSLYDETQGGKLICSDTTKRTNACRIMKNKINEDIRLSGYKFCAVRGVK